MARRRSRPTSTPAITAAASSSPIWRRCPLAPLPRSAEAAPAEPKVAAKSEAEARANAAAAAAAAAKKPIRGPSFVAMVEARRQGMAQARQPGLLLGGLENAPRAPAANWIWSAPSWNAGSHATSHLKAPSSGWHLPSLHRVPCRARRDSLPRFGSREYASSANRSERWR